MAGLLDNTSYYNNYGDNPRATNMTSVQRISAALSSLNVQHTNLYRVLISNPKGSYNLPRVTSTGFGNAGKGPVNQATAEVLSMFCTDINLPGVSLATTEVRRHGIGPFEKKPYVPVFADPTFQFIVDGEGFVYQYFHDWIRYIINYSMGSRSMNGNRYSQNAYEVDYKVNYQSDIKIEVYDRVARLIKTVTLYEAFPLQLGEMAMSYASVDEIAKLPVTFTFRDFEVVSGAGNDVFVSNAQEFGQSVAPARDSIEDPRTILRNATAALALRTQQTNTFLT